MYLKDLSIKIVNSPADLLQWIDGKDEHGSKLEEVGLTFSSFNDLTWLK